MKREEMYDTGFSRVHEYPMFAYLLGVNFLKARPSSESFFFRPPPTGKDSRRSPGSITFFTSFRVVKYNFRVTVTYSRAENEKKRQRWKSIFFYAFVLFFFARWRARASAREDMRNRDPGGIGVGNE